MQNFIIKTHQKGTVYPQPHLFILNKGNNSGEPHKEPFTTFFVIIFEKETDAANLYFIALSLWKSYFWHQFFCGSVIPFLHIHNFRKEFCGKATIMMKEHEEHLKNVQALKLLEQQEKHFQKNLNLINDLRKAIIQRYCNQQI
jgi:hypothetical protein